MEGFSSDIAEMPDRNCAEVVSTKGTSPSESSYPGLGRFRNCCLSSSRVTYPRKKAGPKAASPLGTSTGRSRSEVSSIAIVRDWQAALGCDARSTNTVWPRPDIATYCSTTGSCHGIMPQGGSCIRKQAGIVRISMAQPIARHILLAGSSALPMKLVGTWHVPHCLSLS